jgi:surface protein
MLSNFVDQYLNGTFNPDTVDDNNNEWMVGKIEFLGCFKNNRLYIICLTRGRNRDVLLFNGDISRWDVDNALYMGFMFNDASSFNGNVSLWNLPNIVSTNGMFAEAISFLGIGLENWSLYPPLHDDISEMFRGATLFDKNLSRFDISSVTSMAHTFYLVEKFTGRGLEYWNTSQVYNMTSMFQGATAFVGDVSSWDVSNVQDVRNMFDPATSVDGDLSTWDVHSIYDASYMFSSAERFKGKGLDRWNVAWVFDMKYMFTNAHVFDAD